jgi:hypothetical protein
MYKRFAKIIDKKEFIEGFTEVQKELVKMMETWGCREVLVVDKEKDSIEVYNPYYLNQNVGIFFKKNLVLQ